MSTQNSAPLVAKTLEEAAENMINEGGSVQQQPLKLRDIAKIWPESLSFRDRLSLRFDDNPLTTTLAAFGLGVLLGVAAYKHSK